MPVSCGPVMDTGLAVSCSLNGTSRSSSLSPRENGSLSIGAGSTLFKGSHLLIVAGDGCLIGETAAEGRGFGAGRYKSSSEIFVGRSSKETLRIALSAEDGSNKPGFALGRLDCGAIASVKNKYFSNFYSPLQYLQ